jgi:hypothetical protein
MYRSVHAIIAGVVLLGALITAAYVMTGDREGLRTANNEEPAAGSSGIARPHPPLDLAPGEPLNTPRRLDENSR